MSQRKVREMALQMLFQSEMAQQSPSEVEDLFWLTRPTSDETREKVQRLFRAATNREAEIDHKIEEAVRRWRLDRLASVDRNILRMAIAEMLEFDTPAAVIIDEAIEIARRFGSEKSPDFVNGILDSVKTQLEERRQ